MEQKSEILSELKDRELVMTRLLNAPRELVWKAITNKEDMKQWYFDIKNFNPEPGFEFSFIGQG